MTSPSKINEELKLNIQQLTDALECSSIERYVSRKATRESFKQEALESWVEYQESGRYFASHELRAWLRTWGSEPERKLKP